MAGMKITISAAMRARDVSRPAVADDDGTPAAEGQPPARPAARAKPGRRPGRPSGPGAT